MFDGLSLEDAGFSAQASADIAKEMALDFLGGAISGGVMGGVSTAVQELPDIGPKLTDENGRVFHTVEEVMAAQAQKKTAPTLGAENQTIEKNKGDTAYVINKLRENVQEFDFSAPVAEVLSSVVEKAEGKTMAEKAREIFKKTMGVVERGGFGNIEITGRSVKDDLQHGVGYAKAAVIPSIPNVLKYGTEIDAQKKWKGRNYDGYIFAAPIKMDDRLVLVAAVVKQTSKNKFYLHEVVDSEGNIIKIDNGDSANQTSLAADGDAGTLNPLPINNPTIPQVLDSVKNGNSALQDAQARGTMTAEGGGTNGEEVYLRGGSQRNDGANPGGELSAVEEAAGRDQSGGVAFHPDAADGEGAALTLGSRISAAELGIAGGTQEQNIRLVTGGETGATRRARAIASERGIDLVLFAGGNLQIGNYEARGYLSGNTMYVRADHGQFTAEQLAKHEACHDAIAKGEVSLDAVKKTLRATFTDEKCRRVGQAYMSAYDGSGLSAQEVFEEIVCDAAGEMNIFAGTTMETPAGDVLQTARQASQGYAREGETRAPPTEGKASRERYWRPDLTRDEWSLLNEKMEQEISGGENFIDQNTKWVYAHENGVNVFALYGIGDGTVATPLYAVGGKKAENAYSKMSDYRRENFHGTDKNGENIRLWSDFVSNQQGKSSTGVHDDGNRSATAGNDLLSEGEREGNRSGDIDRGAEDRGKVKDPFDIMPKLTDWDGRTWDEIQAEKKAAEANGKASRDTSVLLSQQEYAQIQSARMQKYGAMQDVDIPEADYIFAHNKFYILENYGLDTFKALRRIDPAKHQEAVNILMEEVVNVRGEYQNIREVLERYRSARKRGNGNTSYIDRRAGKPGKESNGNAGLDGVSESKSDRAGSFNDGAKNQSVDPFDIMPKLTDEDGRTWDEIQAEKASAEAKAKREMEEQAGIFIRGQKTPLTAEGNSGMFVLSVADT